MLKKRVPRNHLRPKPGFLPFRIGAAFSLSERGGFFQRDFALDMPDKRSKTERLHGRQIRVEPKPRHEPRLLQRPLIQHEVETAVYPLPQPAPFGREHDLGEIARHQRLRRHALPLAERPPCGPRNLYPPGYPLQIGRADGPGKHRVNGPEQGMGTLPRCGDFCPHRLAQISFNLRHGRKPVDEGAKIESRTAHHDRQGTTIRNLAHTLRCPDGPAPSRKRLRCPRNPVKMMRHSRLFFSRGASRDDPHFAVELHGIGIDDLAAKPLRHSKCQRRLAACGRPCNKNGSADGDTHIRLLPVSAMKYVLTLIGNKATPLASAHVEAARRALPAAGETVWLAEGEACDIPFDGDPAAAEAAARAALGDAKIDLSAQKTEGRRKKLLVADMDSTIIEQECIDELAAELGIKPKIAEITERAMRGEIGFEPALRERVSLLKGLHVSSLEKVYRERITEMPGGRTLTTTMRANGAICALVSGGFTFFTSRIARAVGFDVNQANELLFENDALTGIVKEPILGRQAKLDALIALREEHGLAPHETLAVGDGANDLAMIGEAGLGVAYHAKPVVAEAAGARIDHGDLTALLYLQGYRREEFRG